MRLLSSDDWLPPGWTVETRLTSTGRKYKCYIHPTSGLKFYSKPEVSRYLNKARLKDRGSVEKKSVVRKTAIKKKAPTGEKKPMEKKKRHRGTAKKVVFERVTAEGLPPGWIKEIKIQKKHDLVRRDAFYTDPVNGYVFRSMKDSLRYLKTGDPGRLAFKPKPRDSGDINLEDDKTSSPVVPRKQEFAGGGARRQITRAQSLKLGKIASEHEIPEPASSGECLLNSEHISDQCAKVTEKNSLCLSEDKGSKHVGKESDNTKNVLEGSKQLGGGSDNTITVLDSVPLVDPPAEKQPLENKAKVRGKRKAEPGLCNSRNKKSRDLPRRASKRLAGLAADVTPELKTTIRGRQVAAVHSSEIGAGTVEPEPEPETKSCLQPFQTMEVLLNSNNDGAPIEDLAPPQEPAEKGEGVDKDEEKQDYPLSLPLGDGPIPVEHGGVVEDENKVAGNPEPPPELPFGDSWTDPCIEFAIKTLTSDHLSIDEYFQQQLGSPHAQSNNGSIFGLASLQQTDFPFQQYDVAETPVPGPQAPVQPTPLQDGNGDVSLPSSVTTGGYQSDFSFRRFPVPQAPLQQPQFPPAGSASFLSSGETGLRQPGEDNRKESDGPPIQQDGNTSFPSSGATGGLHQRGEDKQKGYQKQLIY